MPAAGELNFEGGGGGGEGRGGARGAGRGRNANPDGMLVGWAPGMSPLVLKPGQAKLIKKGSVLIFQMHYTTNGEGGTDQLAFENVAVSPPGPREVRIRQSVASVNYIDVYIAKGEYRMVEPPAPIGMEAAGVVLEVGSEVHDFLPGDAVAYAGGGPGAYATLRTLPADQVVRVPSGVEAETAAALLFKGLTAEYLLHRTHTVRAGETVLVHAAAGGVGGSLLDRVTVRRNFKPVPYFNPAIEVGADGLARVTVELPDDLTNFKIRAKVAS